MLSASVPEPTSMLRAQLRAMVFVVSMRWRSSGGARPAGSGFEHHLTARRRGGRLGGQLVQRVAHLRELGPPRLEAELATFDDAVHALQRVDEQGLELAGGHFVLVGHGSFPLNLDTFWPMAS